MILTWCGAHSYVVIQYLTGIFKEGQLIHDSSYQLGFVSHICKGWRNSIDFDMICRTWRFVHTLMIKVLSLSSMSGLLNCTHSSPLWVLLQWWWSLAWFCWVCNKVWLSTMSRLSGNWGKTAFRLIEIIRMYFDTSLKTSRIDYSELSSPGLLSRNGIFFLMKAFFEWE